MGLSFKTPPTSPPSSPVKDTQLEIWKNVSMEGRYAPIPFSGFADQVRELIFDQPSETNIDVA